MSVKRVNDVFWLVYEMNVLTALSVEKALIQAIRLKWLLMSPS